MPASFIPAPARAEAPSNTAAPPATADRIVRRSDLTGVGMTYRLHPVRVEIEYSAGRMLVLSSPDELHIRGGEGIEWDFFYTGGADLMVDEITIEFEKAAVFPKAEIKVKKPSAPRHRVLSGPSGRVESATRIEYTIRVFNSFRTEVALARPRLVIDPA